MNNPTATTQNDEAFYAQLARQLDARQFTAADEALRGYIEKTPTPRAWRARAFVMQLQGKLDTAEEYLLESLALNDKEGETLYRLAELCLAKGNTQLAAGYYMLAIAANPEKVFYKQRFLDIAGKSQFTEYNAQVEETVLACLTTPGIGYVGAQIIWYTTLLCRPDFNRLYNDRTAFTKKPDVAPLLRPYFIEGIKKIVIYEKGFEDFIRRLRQWLLMGLDDAKKMPPAADYLRLADAVASYCFATEYIMAETPEERARLDKLAEVFRNGDKTDALQGALLACYGLDGIPAIFASGSGLHAILQEKAELQRLCAVFDVGAINDSTSREVKAQYETFPYPRWSSTAVSTLRETLSPLDQQMEKSFLGAAPDILVAGCGTGQETLARACHYPQGHITAIDLSSASLAYASMKAQQYGVTNISFRQQDILTLADDAKMYDFVSSVGVLHHMAQPLTGWKIVASKLKSGGVMKIGLYSKIARRDITAAREAIAKLGIGHDRDSMIAFREKSAEYLPVNVLSELTNRGDYYTLAMYRDLIFHVSEYCFTIPEIESALAAFGLVFSGFEVAPPVQAQYQRSFPADAGMTSLKNWHEFEEANPHTFRNMYHFWCRKV